ncbi:MAG: tyrosine-type recombinase/integrase [Planctomycetaceae bacterium]
MAKTRTKPGKPRRNFPLFPHQNGQWAKKIKGKQYYFGPWSDPEGSEAKYLAQREYLQAGRTPPQVSDGCRIVDLVNRFLTVKQAMVDSQELSPRSFLDYFRCCENIISHFERERLVSDIRVEDFERYRIKLGKVRGLSAIGVQVTVCRMVFRFAFENELIDRPVRFGQHFKRPSKKALRLDRARKQQQHGLKMFEAAELRTILDAASDPLRAMVYLGVNGGLGASDLAELTDSSITHGWLDFPRVKTGIPRRIPLWPETIEAIKSASLSRPKARDDVRSDLLFITKYGRPWVRTGPSGTSNIDKIADAFAKLLKALGLKRQGVGFYALRHTFETIAGGSGDQVAVDAIMGHVNDDMASLYRERIDDSRLTAVSDRVRDWLFG